MIYPTIKDLTKGKYNRYELSIATAKGARLITDEYVRQRAAAESAVGGNKENDKPVAAMIDKKLKDEKAVKLSIDRLDSGEFEIVEEEELDAKIDIKAEAEAEKLRREAKGQADAIYLNYTRFDSVLSQIALLLRHLVFGNQFLHIWKVWTKRKEKK